MSCFGFWIQLLEFIFQMKIWFALEVIWAEAPIASTKQNPTRNYWLTITSVQTNQQPKNCLTCWEIKQSFKCTWNVLTWPATVCTSQRKKKNKSRNMQQGELFSANILPETNAPGKCMFHHVSTPMWSWWNCHISFKILTCFDCLLEEDSFILHTPCLPGKKQLREQSWENGCSMPGFNSPIFPPQSAGICHGRNQLHSCASLTTQEHLFLPKKSTLSCPGGWKKGCPQALQRDIL